MVVRVLICWAQVGHYLCHTFSYISYESNCFEVLHSQTFSFGLSLGSLTRSVFSGASLNARVRVISLTKFDLLVLLGGSVERCSRRSSGYFEGASSLVVTAVHRLGAVSCK